ncbi:MAG: GGDEF domain-containing protein [Bauldia sp.]
MTNSTMFRRAVSCAERAVARLIADEVPPLPHNYEVWYTYFDGTKPALNAAIDQVLHRGGRFDCEGLEELYLAHIGGSDATERVEEISGRVAAEIAALAGAVQGSSGVAAEYTKRLVAASQRLSARPEPQEIVKLVSELIDATSVSQSKNRALEEQLAKSESELEALRQNLVEISREAITDPLTCLGNRRHFDCSLRESIESARQSGGELSLLIVDIDRFKAFNDSHGHVAGDQALKLVAKILRTVVRDADIACRYGGEEFAIILPATGLGEACRIGERLRVALQGREFVKRPTGEKLGRLSVSIGAAQLMADEAEQALIERADNCLYMAKAAGRNRLVSQADAGTALRSAIATVVAAAPPDLGEESVA